MSFLLRDSCLPAIREASASYWWEKKTLKLDIRQRLGNPVEWEEEGFQESEGLKTPGKHAAWNQHAAGLIGFHRD